MLKKIGESTRLLSFVVFIILSSVLLIYCRHSYFKARSSPTEQFILQHMMNANGTLATYLQEGTSDTPEIPAGREALSESLGLWMQYAILKEDQALFDRSLEVLNRWFITPESYIPWKLSEDGRTEVNTNALVDDLRIIDALYKAFDLWGGETYRDLANQLSNTATSYLLKDGIFVDYYDFLRKESSDVISLSYLDMSAMANMLRDERLPAAIYQKHKTLLMNMPNDGRFYPKRYNLAQAAYKYDNSINLIDQLLVALNCADIGRASDELLTFIKGEFAQRQQIVGRYVRATGQPDVSYESPAVYGLSILLSLRLGDVEFAKQLLARMLELRGQDNAYPGGYVFDQNTHLFDNIYPLIAEQQLLEQTRGTRW